MGVEFGFISGPKVIFHFDRLGIDRSESFTLYSRDNQVPIDTNRLKVGLTLRPSMFKKS